MTDTATRDQLDLDKHRGELTGYCYRMLGSSFEAEDAVQETLVRAWRAFDRFEGRSAIRSWLYSIATNVCLDMLKSRQRRALPMDMGPSSRGDIDDAGPRLPEDKWLQPIPDAALQPTDDPADLAESRETIQIAFVAALQHLPPKQRAVLILREVLRWKAEEVAELLDTSVASVNSALQRARATMAARDLTEADPLQPEDDEQRALLSRYVDAFERFDIETLVSLLHEDATMSMPPYELWLHGREEFAKFLLGAGHGCEGSRFEPIVANGLPAFAQWRSNGPDGGYHAWAIHVVEISDGVIRGIHFFVDPNLFPQFGLPTEIAAQRSRSRVTVLLEQPNAAVEARITVTPPSAIEARAAARVAETERWKKSGERSPAHELAKKTGTSVTQARAAIETGRRLQELAATANGATKLLVRVDLEKLVGRAQTGDETCEIAGYGPVAVSAVHELMETRDPFLAAVVTEGKEVVGVTHLGRRPTAYQRSALEWLYPSCAAEGCNSLTHLEMDHREDWATTKRTVLELLDRLCPHHHDLKTNDGWALAEGEGKRAFVPPDDPRHPQHARPLAAA